MFIAVNERGGGVGGGGEDKAPQAGWRGAHHVSTYIDLCTCTYLIIASYGLILYQQ